MRKATRKSINNSYTDDDVHGCDHVNNGVDDGNGDEDFAKSSYLLCGETKQALERALQSTHLEETNMMRMIALSEYI